MTIAAAADAPIAPATGQVSSRRLLFWFFPVATAMYALFNGIQQVLLPGQIEAIDPAHKIGNLALIMGVSAVTSVFGLLAGGAVSDRTTGRWGRRTPSLVAGAVASGIAAVLLGLSSSLTAILVLMASLWFALNYFQGALTAILPDRVPLERRGTASSIIALGVPIGVIAGVNIAAHMERPLALAALALFVVAATAGLVLFAPEQPAYAAVVTPGTPREPLARKIAGFFASFSHFDFTLVLLARALMFFSIFSVIAYTYFILQDYVGTANLPRHDVKYAVSLMITIQMVACLLSTALSGWIADRLRRPKLLVGISSLGIAAGFAISAFSATWPAMLLMQTSVGFFFGTYMAIDLALASLVLPDPDNEGRDMALLSAAGNLPQMLTPMFAAAVIAQLGYVALFATGALCALGAGIAVFFVRSVR